VERLRGRHFDGAIFDLFGTLVPEFPRAAFYGAVREAADVLGVDREAYEAEWMRTAIERQTGAYADGMPENVRAIVAAIGAPPPSDAAVAAALAPREALYARWFHPRPGAIEILTALREWAVPTGLISMCAPDTPPMWRDSVFEGLVDVEIFSSEVGLRKPDPAIYRAATDLLGVAPSACLYCGDGSYGELTGAAAVGMTAVEIRDPDQDPDEALRPESEDWDGPRIADLRELLPILAR
jgi:putative hydrolase of the HAD superfamily